MPDEPGGNTPQITKTGGKQPCPTRRAPQDEKGKGAAFADRGTAGQQGNRGRCNRMVLALERAHGRDPVDTRYRGAPADIESPPRLIEVKAFGKSNRGYDLWLETRQLEAAQRDPDFYIYVVENVRQGDPATSA